MDALDVSISINIRVRPVGNPSRNLGEGIERPNGTGKRGRGRPPTAPKILALLPALVAFHGPRLLLADIVEAALAAGILAPSRSRPRSRCDCGRSGRARWRIVSPARKPYPINARA